MSSLYDDYGQETTKPRSFCSSFSVDHGFFPSYKMETWLLFSTMELQCYNIFVGHWLAFFSESAHNITIKWVEVVFNCEL